MINFWTKVVYAIVVICSVLFFSWIALLIGDVQDTPLDCLKAGMIATGLIYMIYNGIKDSEK